LGVTEETNVPANPRLKAKLRTLRVFQSWSDWKLERRLEADLRKRMRAMLREVAKERELRHLQQEGGALSSVSRANQRAKAAMDVVVEDRALSHSCATVLLLLALSVAPLGGSCDAVAVVVLVIGVLAARLSSGVLRYRVEQGLYGTNEYEAREIVAFVLERAGGIDLSGGLGARDAEPTRDLVTSGTEAFEGARS
jgi:hypothetical protein